MFGNSENATKNMILQNANHQPNTSKNNNSKKNMCHQKQNYEFAHGNRCSQHCDNYDVVKIPKPRYAVAFHRQLWRFQESQSNCAKMTGDRLCRHKILITSYRIRKHSIPMT